MLKFIVCIFAAASIVAVSVSSPTSDNEARPGYCQVGDVYIKEGEKEAGPIGECTIVTCQSATPGATLTTALTCSEFIPREGCTKSEYDLTKRYPDCCPDEVCNDTSEEK